MKARIASLEKSSPASAILPAAGGVFESASASSSAQAGNEGKKIKVLKDELARMRDVAKVKDDKCELSLLYLVYS